MKETRYTLGSLFDGSGGFPLAGSLCGIEPRWASEVEPYPIAVTMERFPNMKHLGDISKINGAEIEPVDIITFGSPCQDLSVAGKRAGLKHEANGDDETTRSGLFMEAVRIIKEMRAATNGKYPRFALWENVPGAFSSNRGEDFRVVCEELIKIVEPSAVMPPVPQAGWAYADSYLGDGWSLAYRVFDAQYWGVPQRRRRIHLVVDFRGERAREVLFERQGVRGYFTQSGKAWERTPADAEGSAGADDCEREVIGIVPSGVQFKVFKGVSPTLRAAGYKDQFSVCCPVPYTLKIRSGCEGGGKGALIQTDKSATQATNNDQYLFHPITSAAGFKPSQGSKAMGIGWEEEVAPTLLAGQEPGVCYSIENHPADSRVNIDDSGKVQTLTSRMGTGGGNVPMVMEPKPTYCLQGNGIDRADTAGCNGKGWKEDTCYTLNTIDRPAVAYGFYPQMKAEGIAWTPEKSVNLVVGTNPGFQNGVCYRQGGFADYVEGEVGTLKASGGDLGGGSENLICERKVRYIVRRLTPTECARLQGFADWWGHIEQKDKLTDEEHRFWLEVRNTHATINGKPTKEYTKAQMLTWYNKLWTDSAEYKMWGNGIALPPALYVLQGMEDVLNRRTNCNQGLQLEDENDG